jgi:NDP-sugar pyrophosphorylase family protein
MTGLRHALIMAAGRGQRMGPLTEVMPKAMAPFMGTTLIARGIEQVSRHIPYVHVTVGYRGAMLADHVITHGASTVFNTEGHGNCWWVYNTFISLLDEPVCVLTCDNVGELDFELLTQDYRACGEPACMLVPVEPVERLDGDYIFEEAGIVSRISRTDPAPTYCSGIQLLNPTKVRVLTEQVEDFYSLWDQLIAHRELRASTVYPERWYTVDTLAQLEAASQRYQ